jgi:hypothetical protein
VLIIRTMTALSTRSVPGGWCGGRRYKEVMEKRVKPKLIAPKECPFCGAKLSGGSRFTAYYACGGHIWIEQNKAGRWVLRGHTGIKTFTFIDG